MRQCKDPLQKRINMGSRNQRNKKTTNKQQKKSKESIVQKVHTNICTNNYLDDPCLEAPFTEEVVDLVPALPERFLFMLLGISKAGCLFRALDDAVSSTVLTLTEGAIEAALYDNNRDL